MKTIKCMLELLEMYKKTQKKQLILAVDEEDLMKADHLKLAWRIKENFDR